MATTSTADQTVWPWGRKRKTPPSRTMDAAVKILVLKRVFESPLRVIKVFNLLLLAGLD